MVQKRVKLINQFEYARLYIHDFQLEICIRTLKVSQEDGLYLKRPRVASPVSSPTSI